ncbi:MAG: hypothetical protein OEY07_06635 [Gammaproteobacteria bacterium]|nr:hypothetical protein [Gammaproteobacteria bacterium]
MLEFIQSPIFIGVVLFLGIVVLARAILVKDSGHQQGNKRDRRAREKMPQTPFHDSDGVLVTEDRRRCPDRRRSRLLEMKHRI